MPSGPANVGGLNNSGNDPSGAGNSAKIPTAPGTNSAGTAHSSGSAASGSSSAGSGATTGSTSTRAAGGTDAEGPNKSGDAAIDAEDKAVDRKLKSICKGC